MPAAPLRPVDLPGARDSLAAALDALLPRLDAQSAGVSRAHVRAARSASLWWVSPEMTALAVDASRSLPRWTPAEAAPDETGLLYWAGDLPPVPYDGARRSVWPVGALGIPTPPEAPVRAVLWRTVGARVEAFALIAPADLPDDVWQIPVGQLVQSTGVLLASTVDSQPQVTPRGELIPGVDRSWIDGLIALLGATWLLMREPAVCDRHTPDPAGPGASRRRTKRHPAPTVTTIALRAAARPDPTQEPPPGRTPRWKLTTRHLVRGHWRNQPVGPGRTDRELRWIHAHLRGPDGAPLHTTEHVHTWRRPPAAP